MRLGQKNKIIRRWARGGTRPRAVADLRTKSAYLFGAICPARGAGAAVLAVPHADTRAMQRHLDEIARLVRPQAHALIVLDQAVWHAIETLRLPDNLSLLPLQPLAAAAASQVARAEPGRERLAVSPPGQTVRGAGIVGHGAAA
jgi:hypothetical protein